mmetsp:Transcript_33585/g.68574  ORF Transcript_33585/g.68574 Transcript_33585/m.68574 type:complete len:360 (-) Transcript_33585:130-1209(-)
MRGGGPGVTLTLDLLTVTLLVSSVLYAFCLALARRKLHLVHRASGRELGTKKLLVLSVALVCAVRIMSFVGVAAMDITNVRAHYSLRPIDEDDGGDEGGRMTDKNQRFYDASMTVMFDLPNCIVVSTFVLLTLVWAECFLQSRFHTESAVEWETRWLTWYMIFNAALYGTQLVLYVLVITPATAKVVRTVLYALSTGINFAAAFLVLVLYFYLSVSFSGYPFRSRHLRKSLSKISRVTALWCLSRIVWGSSMLVIYIHDVELLQDSETPVLSALTLFLLFLLCEVVPMLALLDYSLLHVVGFEVGACRDMTALASGEAGDNEGGLGDGSRGMDGALLRPSAGDLYGLYAPPSTGDYGGG